MTAHLLAALINPLKRRTMRHAWIGTLPKHQRWGATMTACMKVVTWPTGSFRINALKKLVHAYMVHMIQSAEGYRRESSTMAWSRHDLVLVSIHSASIHANLLPSRHPSALRLHPPDQDRYNFDAYNGAVEGVDEVE
jgi:hypothetical protein